MNRPTFRPSQRPLALDFLRGFEAVARLASFSAAAQELHLSQPAVSRQIKSLEDELGTALFVRGTRRVELTTAGQMLRHTVQPLLARLDASVRQIRMAQGRAQVRLTTFASFASLWLMPRLPGFEQGHPGLDLRLSATDRLVDDDPEQDLALRHCLPDRLPPGAIRLFGEVLAPVVGARLAEMVARGDAPPLASAADLGEHTLLDMDDGHAHSIDLSWTYWLTRQGLPQLLPRRWISMNYTHQQTQAALAGQGVALARLPMVHDALQRGDLVEPFGPAGRLWAPSAYWLLPLGGTAPQRPEVIAFRDWVLAEAALTRQAIGELSEPDGLNEGD